MNQFDVVVDGQIRLNLAEEDMAVLFSMGHINRTSRCRVAGTTAWRTVDDVLPRLKWGIKGISAPTRRLDVPFISSGESTQPKTSAIKAGWICLAIGVPFAWLFPPAHALFTASLVLGIVAMATHQIGRGLALMLSSIFVAAVSMLVSCLLALGLFTKAIEPGVTKMTHDLEDLNRKMQATMPVVKNPVRPPVMSFKSSTPMPNPASRLSASNPAQTDLLPEISRMEKRQRELRRENRELDAAGMEYLQKLRMEYDRVSVR